MSKTKKPQFAKAADATFALRLNAMEERLRDEFGASRIIAATDEPPLLRAAGMMQGEDGLWYPGGTYEGNHLAPTPAEGDE